MYVSAAVGVMLLPVLLLKVIATVLVAEIRAPTMPRPACAVGLTTFSNKSLVVTPVNVNASSAVVFAATSAGDREAVYVVTLLGVAHAPLPAPFAVYSCPEVAVAIPLGSCRSPSGMSLCCIAAIL